MDDFDDFIVEHLTPTVGELKKHDNDGQYKAKVLCRDFWDDFEELHKLIGKRIRWLADNNRLPIYYVGRDSANNALYKLK